MISCGGRMVALVGLLCLISYTVEGLVEVKFKIPALLRPGHPATYNCTFNLDQGQTELVHITDGQQRSIYLYNYVTNEGKVGTGFEDVVSNPQLGPKGGWLSIDVTLPRCAADDTLQCTVFDWNLEHGEDQQTIELVYWART